MNSNNPVQDDFYCRQRVKLTVSDIKEWRFPDWVRPGMLVEIISRLGLGRAQKINVKGESLGFSQPLVGDSPLLVLVTRITDNRGFLDGLVGEELYRFSGKTDVKRAQENL